MKLLTILHLIYILNFNLSFSQEFWNGEKIVFTKTPFTNWELPINQDRITDNVWITRKEAQGLFNISQESNYTPKLSPINTEWAKGSISDGIENLMFQDWENAVNQNPPSAINQPMVLHIIDKNIYIDIKMLTWSRGPSEGGGFSYERSTNQTLSSNLENELQKSFIYPNPTTNFLVINRPKNDTTFEIIDNLGQIVPLKLMFEDNKIDISALQSGLYFLKVNDEIYRFIKP